MDGEGGGGRGPSCGSSSSPCIAGHVYRMVHTTGLDGKNLLKLLPVSKAPGNLSSAMADNVEGNSLARKLVLSQALGQVGNIKVTTDVKKNLSTPTISSIKSNYISDDRLSLQNVTPSVSSDKTKASYVLANSKDLPMTVTSPILPSGHHLQIPADAEVKSVLASSLPPAIQQRILAAAAASNASGTSESIKQPTVIYVSPVNTVKTPVSIPLQNIYPKPVSQVSTSMVLTTPQIGGNGSALNVVTSVGEKTQGAPMKWVVQENPQSPVSCLVPTSSSNKMASEILKKLANMQNSKSNSSIILPACANSMSGSQTEITSIKDNGLVMYDGKIYLLIKKNSKVVSAQDDNQISSTAGIQPRKHTAQPIHSHADSTVTNQVVNLVLSKNKGIAFNAKDPKSSENNRSHLQCELNKNLKVAPVLSTSPPGSLQVTSTSHHEAVSTSGPVSTGINITQKIPAKENESHQILGKTPFLKPSSAVVQHTTMCGAFKEEKQKIEKKSSGMAIQIKHRKDQQRKLYLELRKRFGLFKEERVYLRRIPLPVSLIRSKINEKHGEVEMAQLQKSRKRKKIEVNSALNPNVKCSSSFLGMDNPCTQVIPQQENPSSSPLSSPREDYDTNPRVQSNELDILSPEHHFYENETSVNEGSFRDDIFPFSPPDLEETKRDEKITRLKLLLKEQEAALEEIRKQMKQS